MNDWRKAKASMANGNCVAVKSGVEVRDTRDPSATIKFSLKAWAKFVGEIKAANPTT